MKFYEALRDCIVGKKKIQRNFWGHNGMGKFVFFQPGYPEGIPINKNTSEATGIPEGTVCKFKSYLQSWDGLTSFVHYIPSMDDLMSDDWEVVNSEVLNGPIGS